jgi:lysyl-tRNA synthetase class 2
MLEVYQAYADWRVMMELTRDLVLAAAEATGQARLPRGETGIDLSSPWSERTYFGALEEGTGIDFRRLSAAEVKKKAARCGVNVTPEMSREQTVDGVFDKAVQPALQVPTFIVDYPIELTPLARTKADDPGLAARFELFIGGMELANGYTELNDPLEQRERFAGQLKKGTSRGEVDEDFVLALEHGMPPAGGMGMGIDRLAMILAGVTSVREVILFPHLRPNK